MSGSRLSRLSVVSVLVIALVMALAAIIPSAVQPRSASAQTVYCGSAGYQNVVCPNSNIGLSCNGYSTDANGNTFCTSLATTSCPGGVTVNYGYPCQNGCTGSGVCYNNSFGTTAGTGIGLCGHALVYGPCTPANSGVTTAAGSGQVSCGNGRYAPSAAACASGVTAVASSTQLVTCSAGGSMVTSQSLCPQQCPNGQILPPSSSCSTLSSASTAAASAGGASTTASATGPSNGVSVTFSSGWNLVAAPDGTVISGAGGSLFTFQPGDTSYETLPSTSPAKAGRGYWAYFASNVTQMLPLTTSGSVSVNLPAGTPILIGNPGSSTATVSGATTVSTFDPASNNYVSTMTLKPGQGAWAESDSGGTVTISSAS